MLYYLIDRANGRCNVALRIIVFYILAFVFILILGGIQQAVGLSQALNLPECSPGLAALLMLLKSSGKDGHRFSILDRKMPARKYILAALVPAGGALVVYLVNSLMLHAINFGGLTGIPWFLIFWMPLEHSVKN